MRVLRVDQSEQGPDPCIQSGPERARSLAVLSLSFEDSPCMHLELSCGQASCLTSVHRPGESSLRRALLGPEADQYTHRNRFCDFGPFSVPSVLIYETVEKPGDLQQ